MTEQEAYQRLAALCARSEHCEWEMTEKMKRWQVDPSLWQVVTDRLKKERYIDDERYTRAFVKDKTVYNRWGRRKVEQALRQKHISDDIQERVLSEVDDDTYLAALRPLLEQKRRQTHAASDFELKQKLVRFALGRGYTYDIIGKCIEL